MWDIHANIKLSTTSNLVHFHNVHMWVHVLRCPCCVIYRFFMFTDVCTYVNACITTVWIRVAIFFYGRSKVMSIFLIVLWRIHLEYRHVDWHFILILQYLYCLGMPPPLQPSLLPSPCPVYMGLAKYLVYGFIFIFVFARLGYWFTSDALTWVPRDGSLGSVWA